ncbi:MAG: hypothetical protein GXO33_07320 [Epsilonproteobacteria bacterium]|nr:hypothetical protein [Campylobacterota bacterium]
MKLAYVGPMPKVSDKGVMFDKNNPDKYHYLSAALELAEAFDFNPENEREHVYHPKGVEMKPEEMLARLHRYCDDIEQVVAKREAKAREIVEDLRRRVGEATTISEEGRQAWLKNIDAMYDYYLQFVTNEAAYRCVLEKIASEIAAAKIAEIKVPLFQNFGAVLHDLVDVLENRRPPVDSELIIEKRDEGLFGVMRLKHV